MTGPHPAVAAIRLAVRRELAGGPDRVLVACSGGADSLALLDATVFEARKLPTQVIAVVVDHGLQEGSTEHTARVVEQMAAMGVDETASIRVTVDPGPQGIEAGAREARYAALSQLAEHFGASYVLLGHTLDDQAETVLLGLTHGSGPRSLQGMRRGFYPDDDPSSGPCFVRPLLDISREQTRAACQAEGIAWWEDPHNDDPRFVRSRIRHTVMPMLERELGPGIAAALARTGELMRDDVEALDSMAEHALEELRDGIGVDTARLETFEHALKTRMVRLAALEAGAISSELTRDHIEALADLAWGARDPRQIQLPGHVTAYREGTSLRFRRTT